MFSIGYTGRRKKLDTKEKYKDIIHAQRPPVPEKHPRMTLLNRAKIFSPFAALRGYDEKIGEQDDKKLWTAKPELSEEDKEQIGKTLLQLQKYSRVKVTHFVPSADGLGIFQTTDGLLLSLDTLSQTLRISGESVKYKTDGLAKDRFTEIRFENIVKIEP